jgi:hypothetical protein
MIILKGSKESRIHPSEILLCRSLREFHGVKDSNEMLNTYLALSVIYGNRG